MLEQIEKKRQRMPPGLENIIGARDKKLRDNSVLNGYRKKFYGRKSAFAPKAVLQEYLMSYH